MKLTVLILLAATLLAFADDIEVGGMATVKTRDQSLFPRPVHYAQPITTVPFGTEVTVTGSQGAWFKVEIPSGEEGWLHSTSLTGAVLSHGSSGGEQDPDMIMLAGRGFNADVEATYAQGKSLRFDLVDRMEQIKTSPQSVGSFLAAGWLIPAEEAPEGGTR
ncbi:MAG: SH3 domain-containing protein [Candidatus Fermentibacteraceae bacterium]